MSSYADAGILAGRFVLGIVLLMAGFDKWAERTAFVKTLRHTFDLPQHISKLVARYLPVVEILLGISLLIGLEARAASVVTGVLMVIFSTQLLLIYVNGKRTLACGCFGKNGVEQAVLFLIVRNVLIGTTAVVIAVLGIDYFALLPSRPATLETVPIAAMAVGFLLSCSILSRIRVIYQGTR
jgi:uncharacterized membrane protein YphA (DoxX/SURF4 family)